MSPFISIVVCTYNRSELLSILLESLCKQTFHTNKYEIIVIDNNSTDNTPDVVSAFKENTPNIHYSFEPRPGSSIARNSGWKQAQGQYVAFVDDDCKIPEFWLEIAADIIEGHAPGSFGGPYYAFHNKQKKPGWFLDSYESCVPSDSASFLDKPKYLVGGNWFIRRDILKKTGGFHPEWGIFAKKRGYGEDTELLIRIYDTLPNEKHYYDPKLFVYHYVRPEKTKWRWIITDQFDRGRYQFLAAEAQRQKSSNMLWVITKFCLLAGFLVFASSIGGLIRNRSQFPYLQNYLYERMRPYLQSLGRAYAAHQYYWAKQI